MHGIQNHLMHGPIPQITDEGYFQPAEGNGKDTLSRTNAAPAASNGDPHMDELYGS